MPIDYANYPANWQLFRLEILQRSNLQCECTGQCGIHQPNPFPRRCCELQHKKARFARGQVRLTIAHLCQCDPPCAIHAHVLAMCQRCHLRLDRFKHAAARLRTQAAAGRGGRAERSFERPLLEAPGGMERKNERSEHHWREKRPA